jgi:hypothetical protein
MTTEDQQQTRLQRPRQIADEYTEEIAPFGWPQAMVEAVHGYATSGGWPEIDKEAFRWRRTDVLVRERILAETAKSSGR